MNKNNNTLLMISRILFYTFFVLNYGIIAMLIVAIYGGIEYGMGYTEDKR